MDSFILLVCPLFSVKKVGAISRSWYSSCISLQARWFLFSQFLCPLFSAITVFFSRIWVFLVYLRERERDFPFLKPAFSESLVRWRDSYGPILCIQLIDSWSCYLRSTQWRSCGLRFLEAMGFKPLVWYCQPEKNGAWAKVVENAFGAYTPCGMESLVVCISHLALFGVCFYRIWRTKRDLTVRRYCLRSPYYNYLLGLVAAYCTADPLFRMVMGFSITNLDGHTGQAPFEVSAYAVS